MPVEMKPAAQTLFMGFYTHRDLPLEINGKEREVHFLFLVLDL